MNTTQALGTRVHCGACTGTVEKRDVLIGSSVAARLVCSACGAQYRLDDVCDVCHMARSDGRMAVTTYQSSILAQHSIKHCPTCVPPSKRSLEFNTDFVVASLKYGCLSICIAAIALIILAAIAGHH